MVHFYGDTLRGCPEIEEEDSHGGGFTVVFFTKDFFVRNPQLQYFGGEVGVFKGLDIGRWSLFEALGHAKELDERVESNGGEGVKLWWKPSNIPLDKCLKKLSLDVHALELAKFAVENLEEVDIYVDYNTTADSGNDESPKCLEGVELYGAGASKLNDKGKGIAHEVEEAQKYESSDSEFVVNVVHFNDSEKDQMVGENDGFEGDELIEGFGGVKHNEREAVDEDCQTEVNAIIAFSTVDEHENAIENAYMTKGLDTTQPMSSAQIVDDIDHINKKGNISKTLGKKVKTVGNLMWNKAEAMLNGLKTPPLEDLDKILRDMVTCLVKWNKKVGKVKKEKRDNDEDTKPKE